MCLSFRSFYLRNILYQIPTFLGAAFALLSGSEMITFLIATVSFLTLYPATLQIYRGFAWLFAAGVLVIPIILST